MKSTSTTNRTEYYKISSFIFLYFFTSVCQYWTAGDLARSESQPERIGDWNRLCGERDILRNS